MDTVACYRDILVYRLYKVFHIFAACDVVCGARIKQYRVLACFGYNILFKRVHEWANERDFRIAHIAYRLKRG